MNDIEFPPLEHDEAPPEVTTLTVADQEAFVKAVDNTEPSAALTEMVAETPVHKKHSRYHIENMKINDSFVYSGTLASGRVLASLKGKSMGWRLQAKDKAGVITVTRLS